MVPFSSLSERLFRVSRQSAKELDKRVNLDIRGTSVEIDRSVLEQMAAPFEHLLRNAIVHGIETRERRGASGKAETGELLLQVSQQGNEVVIQISDDEAFTWARRLAKEEGIFGGISSGGNVAAAAKVAARPENKGKLIVTIGCSTGERYLSTALAAEARAEVGA